MSATERIQSLAAAGRTPKQTILQSMKDTGKKAIGCFPIYLPEEIIYASGLLPVGMWGGQTAMKEVDRYIQGFGCSIMRANMELGIRGEYRFLEAIVIPTYCDTMKSILANWIIAVEEPKVFPYTVLQNRQSSGSLAFILHQNEKLRGELAQLMDGVPGRGLVLVVGLGNRAITPDAIGPKVHEHTLVTRHLVEQIPEHFGAFRPVASLSAGVLGTTGMESGELVQAVCRRLKPACVVAVDALASRSLKRLCRTVQLSDTGIAPGSGVGNHRWALDRASLGVPVLAVGVPTVVDASTLAADLLGQEELPPLGEGRDLLVTPKDIDSQVDDLAKVIGYGISLALQPGLDVADLDLLLS